jgi:hypothetical protein
VVDFAIAKNAPLSGLDEKGIGSSGVSHKISWKAAMGCILVVPIKVFNDPLYHEVAVRDRSRQLLLGGQTELFFFPFSVLSATGQPEEFVLNVSRDLSDLRQYAHSTCTLINPQSLADFEIVCCTANGRTDGIDEMPKAEGVCLFLKTL